MTEIVNTLVILCTAGGVAAGLLVIVSVRDGRLALRVALEFWTAAGMLRLANPPSWGTIGAAAGILAVRQLINVGLRLTAERAPS